MDLVYSLLDSGATKEAIEMALGKVCELIPELEAQGYCKEFINQEYEKLLEWLETAYSSEMICTLMTACDYPVPPINSACDACLVGFTFIEDLFKFKPTEKLIEQALNYVCQIFPAGNLRDECEGFID
jgi:hypothetical protein